MTSTPATSGKVQCQLRTHISGSEHTLVYEHSRTHMYFHMLGTDSRCMVPLHYTNMQEPPSMVPDDCPQHAIKQGMVVACVITGGLCDNRWKW